MGAGPQAQLQAWRVLQFRAGDRLRSGGLPSRAAVPSTSPIALFTGEGRRFIASTGRCVRRFGRPADNREDLAMLAVGRKGRRLPGLPGRDATLLGCHCRDDAPIAKSPAPLSAAKSIPEIVMRLHVLSDLHLEHATFGVPSVQSDVLVLAGDILCPGHEAVAWAARESVCLGRPVVFVGGNHEFYDALYQQERVAMQQAARRTGVHCLDRSSVVVDRVRFIGCTLWTDFGLEIQTEQGLLSDVAIGMSNCARHLVDYRAIRWQSDDSRRLLLPGDTLSMHVLEREWLDKELSKPFDGKTVVVTHHAPHRLSLAAKFSDDWVSTGFVSQLPDSFFAVPDVWIHGHTHARFDYRAGSCRVVCNPRGYRLRSGDFEVPGFDPGCVVNV